MATVNVGSMAARLGLDPSEFLDKMKGVQGFNGMMSGEMARAWKQTSREGAESFRLIDEALGIRVSRPLTRILTQEFPAFARGLQTVLGGAVFGALATVGVEAFDKLEKKIERAQKAQEEFRESAAKIGTTLENISDSWAGKIAGLSNQNPITALGKQGAEEARRQFDELFKITEDAEKKRAAASGISTQALSGVGDWWHSIWSSEATLLSEQAQTELQKIRHEIDEAFRADHLAGGHSAAKVIQDDLDQVNAKLEAMKPLAAAADAALALAMSANVGEADTTGAARSQAEAVEAQTAALSRQKEMLEQVKKEIEGQREAWEKAKAAADAHTEAVKAQAAVVSLHKEMASSLAKLQPETDPAAKLDIEIAELRSKAVANLSAMVPDAQRGIVSAFSFDRVSASVSAYEKELDRLKIKLEGDILSKQALDLLNKPLPGEPKGTALPFDLAGRPVMPTLGAGGRPAAKFDTFANDTVAQYAMASQAIDDAMSPQQKYKLVEQELDLLLGKKLIGQNAYNAALAQAIDLRSRSAKQGLEGAVDELNPGGGKMQELQQRMDALRGMQSSGMGLDGAKLNAGDLAAVQLAMEGIADEQDKILLKTGGIDTGIKAWADDLQKVQSAGELTFEALSQASKGFEDNAAKSFFLIMDSQRGQQRQLIHDLEAMSSKYFEGLAQMGMKKGMDQLLAPLAKMFTAGGSGAGAAAGVGKDAVGAASLTSASTMLHSAATALLTAATALRTSAAGGMGGGSAIPFLGGGAGDAMDAGAAIPFFAAGGDATPGSSFISGEAGAERVDLDRSGGAHITPLGSGAGGGDTHQHFDMRGAVVTDDLMRRAEAAHMMKASEGRMMQAMPAMQREIALRKRT